MDLSVKKTRYLYNGVVTDVHDGDTITVDLDLGLNVWCRNVKLRLLGLNAPEVGSRAKDEYEALRGEVARQWLQDRLLGRQVLVQTKKDKRGKYGRYLAIVWEQGENVNRQLLELGYAEPWSK